MNDSMKENDDDTRRKAMKKNHDDIRRKIGWVATSASLIGAFVLVR